MKKLIVILLISLFAISTIGLFTPTVKGENTLIFICNTITQDATGLSGAYSSDISIIGQTIQPTTTAYLTTVQFQVYDDALLTYGAKIYCRVYQINAVTDTPSSAGAISIENSTEVNIDGQLSNVTRTWLSFGFTGTNQLTTSHYYAIDMYVRVAGNLNIATHQLRVIHSISTNVYTGQNYNWESGAYAPHSNRDCNLIVYGNTVSATPTPPPPTPAPPTDSAGIYFTVNGSNSPNSNCNITWSIPDGNGNGFTSPTVGNDGTNTTLYFKNGQDILLKTQVANGYYFYNFSLTATGYNFTYPIDNWLVTLENSKSIYYFNLIYGTVPNLVNITLNDGAHGSIYFQYITGDSVQQGDTGDIISGSDTTKYGAGTYHVNRYSTMHIGALCDSGYKVSYYDEYANGIHQKITSLPLTIIATTDMIITPIYVIDTGSGSTIDYDNATLVNFLVYILLLIVPPMALAGILGSATKSGFGAIIGFVGGLIIMLVIGVIVGFVPFWAIIIIGIMLVLMLWLIFRGLAG